jgi:hypothetical protein
LLLLSAAVGVLRAAPPGAKLRRSNIDASAGATEEIARIVGHIRSRWPKTTIVLRADSGFARDELMSWAEAHDVCASR